ncbi:hypothetical protein [Xanthomarina sp. F2636L]|uniref:hypothetical protein n=1 Tax=Xanthomarina sp. F2636L TaxID=2996018 RepID=UPI00225E0B4F|nr:hypothetical protein [Xanthomarina sp. F2636L]MCX7549769.1 hypothetical protein [Xanthomarina sp. F2636L]
MIRNLLICLTFLWFQNKFSETDFLIYHQEFNKVEELIVNEDFIKAEKQLNELLNNYKPAFAKDYIIASQISLINNNKSKALDWIKEAFKHGVKIKCLKEIQIFNEKLNDFNWQKLETLFPDLYMEYQSKISIGASKAFHRNYQKEQGNKRSKEYKGIVYSNFYKIKEGLDKNAYPGENIIGIDNSDDASKINDCDLDNAKVTVTLLHYDYPISDLTEEKLMTAIKSGAMHPREFAISYAFQKGRVSILYRVSRKTRANLSNYHFNFPFEKQSTDFKKVNADRSKFGICSIETDKIKPEIEEKYGIKLKFGYR